MAVASGAMRSTLNPNAPLFIPAAYRHVEDFSPEWWELVQTSTWFREYWFQEHKEQQTFDGSHDEDDDVANLLPELDEIMHLEELDEAVFHDAFLPVDVSARSHRGSYRSGIGADELLRGLNLRSPRGCGIRSQEPAKYWDKPVQVIGPKHGARHFIQQPR